MTHVVATIAQKAEPAMGKKRGRIKGTDGTVYQISPVLAQQVIVGQSYDLDYKDEEFNGMKYRVVESIMPVAGGVPAPLPGAMQRVGHPSEAMAAAQQWHPQVSDEKGNDIATLAIAKVWLEKIPVGDEAGCLHALRAARRAWLQFKNNPNNVDRSEDYGRIE